MKGAAAAALALGVVLPMALARGFSGQDGNSVGREACAGGSTIDRAIDGDAFR